MRRSVHKALQKGRPTAHYDDGERVITWVLTTGTGDRDGETVNPAGGNFDEFKMNPVVMYNHNTDAKGLDAFPIGRVVGEPWLEQIGEGTQYPEVPGPARDALLGKVKFSQENPQGDLAYRMAKEGMLVGGSISFLPEGEVSKNDTGGNHYDNWKLLEFTICPVGSNPDAVKLSKGLHMAQKSLKYYRKNKTAWVLKTGDGSPLDREMEEYLEQRGLDEVRVEDEAPPEGEEWVEEEVQMPEEKYSAAGPDFKPGTKVVDDDTGKTGTVIRIDGSYAEVRNDDGTTYRKPVSWLTLKSKDIDTQDEDEIIERCGTAMCKEGIDPDMVELAVKRLKKSIRAKSPSRYMALVSSNGQIFRAATNSEILEAKRNGGEINVNGIDYDVMEVKGDGNDSYKPFSRGKSAPPGHQAASKLMKAIEDELPLVEQPKIRDAMENALKQLRRARSIAYKDLESMDDAIAARDSEGSQESMEDEFDAEHPTMTEEQEEAKTVDRCAKAMEDEGVDPDMVQRAARNLKSSLRRGREKRLSKSDRALVKAAMDYLDEASNNSPQYLAAGMKHHAAQLKALTEDPAPEMTDADLTDEDKEQMDEALKRLKSLQSRFDNAVFAATGL